MRSASAQLPQVIGVFWEGATAEEQAAARKLVTEGGIFTSTPLPECS